MRCSRSLAIVSVAALLAAPAAAQAPAGAGNSGYTLGRGLPLGGSGVRLGGYATIQFDNPTDAPAAFTFDELSLFIFGDIGARLRFFIEAEETQFLQIDSTGVDVRNNSNLERLYVDYRHADTLKVRVGKFLTPVGTWNEIHPNPLTWTVSRPVASYATFPVFTTGAQAFGTWASTRRDVDYNFFVQHNGAIDNSTGKRHTERMIGGRVRMRQRGLEVGLPIVRYTERDSGAVVTFSGADLLTKAGRLEVRSEATAGRVRSPEGESRSEYAVYLQGLVALTDRVYVVARQEWAHSRDDETYTATSGGLLFRPLAAMSLKLEGQRRSGQFFPVEAATGNRLLASFGVLF
ncbi:MAG: hypothetical protein ABI665_26115 [Vicinamibacterales bacterium]